MLRCIRGVVVVVGGGGDRKGQWCQIGSHAARLLLRQEKKPNFNVSVDVYCARRVKEAEIHPPPPIHSPACLHTHLRSVIVAPPVGPTMIFQRHLSGSIKRGRRNITRLRRRQKTRPEERRQTLSKLISFTSASLRVERRAWATGNPTHLH